MPREFAIFFNLRNLHVNCKVFLLNLLGNVLGEFVENLRDGNAGHFSGRRHSHRDHVLLQSRRILEQLVQPLADALIKLGNLLLHKVQVFVEFFLTHN